MFTETVAYFLIPDFNKNIFICGNSHFIKYFKKLLKVSVYSKSSLFESLYLEHKFLGRVTYANLSIDNRLCSKSQKRGEYVLKT